MQVGSRCSTYVGDTLVGDQLLADEDSFSQVCTKLSQEIDRYIAYIKVSPDWIYMRYLHCASQDSQVRSGDRRIVYFNNLLIQERNLTLTPNSAVFECIIQNKNIYTFSG